jgi:hypothetical protein
MKRLKVCFVLTCLFAIAVNAQDIINLYPAAIPNAKQTGTTETNTTPYPGFIRQSIILTLKIYLAEKEKVSGAVLVICPGGGYSVIVYQGEGVSTAKEFAKNGITAFELKYRLPNDSLETGKSMVSYSGNQDGWNHYCSG